MCENTTKGRVREKTLTYCIFTYCGKFLDKTCRNLSFCTVLQILILSIATSVYVSTKY